MEVNNKSLERLVKQVIREEKLQELDKTTYDSAAKKASDIGMSSLSDKFKKHGEEHGLGKEREIFTLVFKDRDGEHEYTYKVDDIQVVDDKQFKMVLSSSDNFRYEEQDHTTHRFGGFLSKSSHPTNPNKPGDVIKVWKSDEWRTLAKTRRDAKALLNILNTNGVDTSGVDPRSLTYGYSTFDESIKRRKTLSEDRTDYEMSGARSRSDYVSSPRERDVTGMFGKYAEDVPPIVIRYLRKNPEAIIKRLYKIYGDKIFDYLPQQNSNIDVVIDLINDNPNDADLGKEVRSYFIDNNYDTYMNDVNEKKWIKNAIEKPGSLRKKMGIKKNEKLTDFDIKNKLAQLKSKDKNTKNKGIQGLGKRDLKTFRQLNLAKTLRGMK